MTKTRFLALITALALLIAIPTSVFAQPAPPHEFLGTVTLDGATAADGAAVTAWIDDAQVASTTVSGGTRKSPRSNCADSTENPKRTLSSAIKAVAFSR